MTEATKRPRRKVVAAGATALAGAAIVFVAAKLGVDIPEDVAYGMAGAALLAFGGGYAKAEA